MATTTKTKIPLAFDQAKLQNMQEPITVRVDKMKGNNSSNVPIPGKGDGAAPGTNWSREEVLNLENWILTEWSGGGCYRFSITDATGNTMKWETAYDPRLYPEKVPPNQMSAAALPSPQAQPAGVPAAPGQIYTPPAQPIPSQAMPFGVSSGFGGSQWPPPAATFGYGSQVGAPQPQPQPQLQPQPQPQQIAGYNPQTGQPIYAPVAPPTPTPYAFSGAFPGAFGQPWSTPIRGFGDERSSRGRYGNDWERHEYERREHERDERQRTTEREAERLRYQEELRRKDEELRTREMAQKEVEHKAALERTQQQHTAEMAKMRDEIRRLGEKGRDTENDEVKRAREDRQRMEREREREQINQQFQQMQASMTKLAEKPTEDPRMRTLELEIQKQREDARVAQEQAQRERERYEAQHAQEALVQQMKDQEIRTQTALKEATTNRPDPMVEFMKENARMSGEQSRMQAENMREIARMQQMGSDRMAQMMMTPQALAGIIRDSSSNSDTLMKNVVETYGSVFGTMRNAIEQVANLTGGTPEPPAARIIEQGLNRAGEMAERYIGMKAAQAQGEARVATAKAQSDAQVRTAAMHAQAQAATAAAAQAQAAHASKKQQPEFTTASGQTGPIPHNGQPGQPTQPTQSGLGGTPPPAAVKAPKPPPQAGKPAAPSAPIDMDEGTTDPKTGHTVPIAKVIPMKRAGRTDAEWFGVALESVTRLRTGVKVFLDNLTKIQAGAGEEDGVLDEDGNVIGLDPNGAIDAILKGVNYVSVNDIEINAFEELFKQGRYAEFMDVMIPEAPEQYKIDCVKILTEDVEVKVEPPANVIDVSAEKHQPETEQPPVEGDGG